jgi:hypothetical protein
MEETKEEFFVEVLKDNYFRPGNIVLQPNNPLLKKRTVPLSNLSRCSATGVVGSHHGKQLSESEVLFLAPYGKGLEILCRNKKVPDGN